MSAIELLQQNPLIIISLAVTVLPMLVAVGLMAIANIQAFMWQRQQIKMLTLAARGQASPVDPVDSDAGAILNDIPEDTPETSPTELQTTTETAPSANTSGDPMQSLLSSVFTEEVDTSQFDMLLTDLNPININDLLQSARQVHQKLLNRGRSS